MSYFECCHKCPSTKRHPGCHSKCKDYKDAKEAFEAAKEMHKKDADGLSYKIYSLRCASVLSTARRRQKFKR